MAQTLLLAGWSLLQIAIAKERHLAVTGVSLFADADGLYALRYWWRSRYGGEPTGSKAQSSHASRDWARQVLVSLTS